MSLVPHFYALTVMLLAWVSVKFCAVLVEMHRKQQGETTGRFVNKIETLFTKVLKNLVKLRAFMEKNGGENIIKRKLMNRLVL